ncbi:DUF1622 domain-containing protein [Thalassiella azotivora]
MGRAAEPVAETAETAESVLGDVVALLVTVVEACGAVVIIVGALWAFGQFVGRAATGRTADGFVTVRLRLGRFLALGLEFQLAGDVLRTAVAPTFEQIGQLAAIAAIRTALNYFLSREIAEERRQLEQDAPDLGVTPGPPEGGDPARG